MNKLDEKTRIRDLIVFAIILLIEILVLCHSRTLNIISDSIGDLATPAYLAGLDWSDVVATTKYYGYGYKWIYFIAFKLSDNPFSIRIGMLLINIVVQSLVLFFFYRIFSKYETKSEQFLPVVIMTIFFATRIETGTSSECSLFCLLFLVSGVLILAHNTESKRVKYCYTILFSLLLAYSITLHERSVALIISVVIVYVIDLIYTRKPILPPILFIGSLVVFFVIQRYITAEVQHFFWTAKAESGKLANTSSAVMIKPWWIFQSMTAFKLFCRFIISNLLTWMIKTLGIGFLTTTLFLYGVFCLFFRREKLREFYSGNRVSAFVFLMSYFASMIILVGISLKTGNAPLTENLYNMKGINYFRYYTVFSYPAIFITCYWWKTLRKSLPKWFKGVCFGILLLLSVYFVRKIVPDIVSSQYVHSNWSTLTDFGMKNLSGEKRILINLGLMIVMCFLVLFDNRVTYVVWNLGVLFFILITSTHQFNVSKPSYNTVYEDIYFNVKELENQGIELPKDVYLEGDGFRDQPVYMSQYLLPRYSIHPTWEIDSPSVLLLRQSGKQEEVLQINPEDYIGFDCGEDIYLLLKQSEYESILISKGISFLMADEFMTAE